ncbi:MAG TPA: hypothetical protein VLA49_11050 [Anaerolineales bacterium]|nr:hypothetical protein [Anaerolineales bacterium]
MKVFSMAGRTDIAVVYMADMGAGRLIEFVEALQPPYCRDERWILMVSTLYGCPVRCLFCDAGGDYRGKPSKEEILAQIDYMVAKWYPDFRIPASKFKIQFARMGEPALNPAVLQVLRLLPQRYQAPGLMPSISTIAPKATESFFEELLQIKEQHYSGGRFQFQYSLHTSDQTIRDTLIPVKKWDFSQMAAYGERFYKPGDRKITLNFALAENLPIEAGVLLNYFDPNKYLIKITPINPTSRAKQNNLVSHIDPNQPESGKSIAHDLSCAGYQVIISIGEVEENLIGSNCGQYVLNVLKNQETFKAGYTYQVQEIPLCVPDGNPPISN